MEILVLDKDANTVTIDTFFSKYSEFSENQKLAEQTARFLKVLLRHPEPEIINKITDKVEKGHEFKVFGSCRTYTIVFEIKNDSLVLKELY